MAITDEIRKTLSDPKPLYALAGAGDLAAEKLKDAPERLKDTPALIAEAGATLTTIANKIAAEAPERFAKASATVQDVATKGLRPDTQALRGAAQTVALQQVGRLLEAAGKAVETYDELAERGKVVVGRYTGGVETVAGETVEDEAPVKVVVEQVIEDDEITEAPVETAEEAAQVFEEAAVAEEAEEAAKPQAARRTAASKPAAKKAAPRKRAAAPKTPRPPKA
ncbi:MAG TPA: hypothetical protein VL551_28710 [Actinospica sp.]|jgi:hypothetical protein|nr:hypothetical protein [Actinospica sp.]